MGLMVETLRKDYIETFILVYKEQVYQAKLNFTKKTYSVYTPRGKLMFRREKLTRLDMTAIFKRLTLKVREKGFKFY